MLVNTDFSKNTFFSIRDHHPALKFPEGRKVIREHGVILYSEDSFLPELESDISDKYFVRKISGIASLLSASLKIDSEILICYFENNLNNKAELCRRIKSVESIAHIPVIILLNKLLPVETRMMFYQAGANEVLCFPAEKPLLACKIQNLITLRNKMKKRFSQLDGTKEVKTIYDDDFFMKNAIQVLEENISDPSFTALEFSRKINVSRSTLYRKFKNATGVSPNEVIIDTRLKTAAKILQKRKTPISCLAYNLGFSSPSYFTKIFRLKFNMTPTAYHYFHLKEG